MVICLERGADLHMTELMPLPLTVSCLSKIQIGFTFLVPAHPVSPGQRAVKRVCVYRLHSIITASGACYKRSGCIEYRDTDELRQWIVGTWAKFQQSVVYNVTMRLISDKKTGSMYLCIRR